MSDFGRAFRREFGKNTGKFISNVVFGDKHSTPYRRVDSARQERQANINARHAERMQLQQERLRIQQERLQMQQERQNERSRKNDLLERQVEIQEDISRERRKNQLYAVDSAINSAIDNLLSNPIPSDFQGLEQYILDLQVHLNASKSEGFSDERKIRKKYFNALRERFFQAFNKLELLYPDSHVIDDYIAAYEDLRFDKYRDDNEKDLASDKFARLSYILKRNIPFSRQRLENELEILIYYTQKYEWTKDDLEKGIKDKVLSRAKMVVEKLAELDPDNTLIKIINDYEQSLRKSKRKKLFIILASILVLIFAIFCLKYGRVFFWSCVITACVIPLTYFSVKYYYRNRHVIKTVIQKNKESIEEDQSPDIYIDLNQHNRISDTLKNIWDRYKDSIPDTIFNRPPIFASDGVKDSILFVGVNPSYNETDDDVLISTDDHRSLLYRSFYKMSDAPEYFKTLEEFASELGLAYSQMNLLYLRENDRNVLANLNSEFIREQLELTYDTIIRLHPTAIIFMSDWCRQLIDGPGRWVDSKNGQLDNLILNGTNIPIFFSDDISILNIDEKNALSRRIKIRPMPKK